MVPARDQALLGPGPHQTEKPAFTGRLFSWGQRPTRVQAAFKRDALRSQARFRGRTMMKLILITLSFALLVTGATLS